MDKQKSLTYEEFIKLATKNYAKGGDTFCECWDKRHFEWYCSEFGAITESDALEMFRLELATKWG